MRLPSIMSHPRARVSALCGVAFLGAASQAWAQSPGAGTAAQPPYNIIFVISDQEADHLLVTGNDYELPARAEIGAGASTFAITTRRQPCVRHPASPPGLQELLTAPGMPQALAEYQKGWSGSFGYIPTVRPDMWSYFYNYYLNLIRDNDQGLQLLLNAMDQLGLWKNTVVVVTADHGEMAGSHGGLRGKGPFAYELNSHVPLWIVHPAYEGGKTSIMLTSHIDLLPTFVGMTGLPEAQRAAAVKGLPGHDFSALLANAQSADLHANRPGVLFNYVGLHHDGNYLLAANKDVFHGERSPPLSEMHPDLNKRGFMCFAFDGRYKFARYYAPAAFNTPQTLDQIFQYNDVQLFDLKQDPQELHNLALDREKNKDLICG